MKRNGGGPHPQPDTLSVRAELLGDRTERFPLRSVLVVMVEDHQHRTFTQLAGYAGAPASLDPSRGSELPPDPGRLTGGGPISPTAAPKGHHGDIGSEE